MVSTAPTQTPDTLNAGPTNTAETFDAQLALNAEAALSTGTDALKVVARQSNDDDYYSGTSLC